MKRVLLFLGMAAAGGFGAGSVLLQWVANAIDEAVRPRRM